MSCSALNTGENRKAGIGRAVSDCIRIASTMSTERKTQGWQGGGVVILSSDHISLLLLLLAQICYR